MRGLKVGLLCIVVIFLGVTALDLFSRLREKSASLSCSFFLQMKRPLLTTGVCRAVLGIEKREGLALTLEGVLLLLRRSREYTSLSSL